MCAAEVNAAIDEWGVMYPDGVSIKVARNLFIRMYPRMVEIIQLLGSSSLMALPSEEDLDGPLSLEIEKYLETDSASARDRVQLFHLAWDVACSAFGSRQVLYERYFQGEASRNSAILHNQYNTEPLTALVREFMARG